MYCNCILKTLRGKELCQKDQLTQKAHFLLLLPVFTESQHKSLKKAAFLLCSHDVVKVFFLFDSLQDESHFLKNIKTARCKSALPLLKVQFVLIQLFKINSRYWAVYRGSGAPGVTGPFAYNYPFLFSLLMVHLKLVHIQ